MTIIETDFKQLITYANKDIPYGHLFEGGYQKIPGIDLKSQRDPNNRFKQLNLDFKNKIVLDIGCNQGGCLFYLSDIIERGIGIDVNPFLINVANKIKSTKHISNLEFYTFDLDKDPLELINNLTSSKIDIVFLLSICMWIKNWKEVIDFIYTISDILVFESNGSIIQQKDQLLYLESKYNNIQSILSTQIEDGYNRKLYICK